MWGRVSNCRLMAVLRSHAFEIGAMMIEKPVYAERYCAFVDILGFRQLIHQIDSSGASFEALHSLLARVHNANSGAALDVEDTDFRAQSISDAVAISTKPTASGLGEIFGSLVRLSLDLLVEGYFIRGAIVKAPLYHDGKMVIGKALVEAYYYESEVARFPRIVVTRQVKNDFIGIGKKLKAGAPYPRIENLRPSADGPMYLDVLEPVLALMRKDAHPYKQLDNAEADDLKRFKRIRDKIQERYEETMDAPRQFEKVRWFAQYWNDKIPDQYNLRIRDADRTF